MICKKPFMKNGIAIGGCGKCLPCTIRDRRLWTHRILLETLSHSECAFGTLTYKQKDITSLNYDDTRYWLMRLRKAIYPKKIRYYLVGEYGTQTQRPHYHVALFGLPTCERGRTEHRLPYCCSNCELIKKTWGLGGIDLRGLGPESAQYIAGYVTGKLTGKTDRSIEKLSGRVRERSFKSQGLGKHALPEILKALTTEFGCDFIAENGDVPLILNHGTKSYPLGRFLRSKIRELYNFEHTGAQPGWSKKKKQEMQELLEKNGIDPKYARFSDPAALLEKENKQKILNIESRQNLKIKGGL